MIGRQILPLSDNHSVYDAARDELLCAIRRCALTREEQHLVVHFVFDPTTHAWLYETHVVQKAIGYHIVITLRPGYVRLLAALGKGADATLALVRSELAARGQQVAA